MKLSRRQTIVTENSLGKPVGVCHGPLKNSSLEDRCNNGIWGQKDLILEGLTPRKIVLMWVDVKKYLKEIAFNPQKLKKWVKTAAHIFHPT